MNDADIDPVAVLCCAKKSVYHSLQNVVCYDQNRDIRTFAGGMRVVGHPPCAPYSAYCAHQWKPVPGIKELGPLVVDWLRECGGILEHPAHSRLFDVCHLPKPNESGGGLVWSIEVDQSWWGDTRTKKTWLCFFGIWPKEVQLPLRLHEPQGDRRRWQVMSHTQRSATHPEMAKWLVNTARFAKKPVAPPDTTGPHEKAGA